MAQNELKIFKNCGKENRLRGSALQVKEKQGLEHDIITFHFGAVYICVDKLLNPIIVVL